MTRVDFYLTKTGQQKQILVTACRLAEKAFSRGHHVFIHTDDAASAQQLDELMWTFRQGSFVPHAVVEQGNQPDKHDKVVIGHDHDPEFAHDVLINLASTIPEFFSRFERVAEIVSGDPAQRDVARDRFRYYRDRGYELDTHELNN